MIGIFIGLILGLWFGINMGKDKPVFSNPLAPNKVTTTIRESGEKVLEESGKALEETGKALQEQAQKEGKKE
jgi:hypothetical protein